MVSDSITLPRPCRTSGRRRSELVSLLIQVTKHGSYSPLAFSSMPALLTSFFWYFPCWTSAMVEKSSSTRAV